MFKIVEIIDKNLKASIILEIMNKLPKWFSPPEDNLKKLVTHKDMLFFAVFDGVKAIGFVDLKVHNEYTVEMYNLGILEEHHRQGIGNALLELLRVIVKSALYELYEMTRAFYFKNGFYPLEVFPLYWNKENPCLFLIKCIS